MRTIVHEARRGLVVRPVVIDQVIDERLAIIVAKDERDSFLLMPRADLQCRAGFDRRAAQDKLHRPLGGLSAAIGVTQA